MKTVKIKTERLLLRKMHFCDLFYAKKWYCSDKVTRFSQGKPVPSFYNLFLFYLRTVYHYYLRKNPYSLWAITLDGKMIGFVRMMPFKNGENALLYYMLDPKEQKKGYATESVKALIDYAFSCGIKNVCANCDTNNTASYNLLKNCGLTHFKTVENVYHYPDGRTGDRAYFKIEKD